MERNAKCEFAQLAKLENYFAKRPHLWNTVNFFFNNNLAKLLLKKNLTLFRTIRAHRREIPITLNNRIKLFSSVFLLKVVCAWLHTKLKETKKPVMLLSSSHTINSVTTDECKKTLMILDYNQRKGGVDMLDENLEKFLCLLKTVRWPLLFF